MGRRAVVFLAWICAGASCAAGEFTAECDPSSLYYGGIEASVRSASAWLGYQRAQGEPDESGWRVRINTVGGVYRAGHPIQPGARFTVTKSSANLMLGQSFTFTGYQTTFLLGAEVDARVPDDPAAGRNDRGTRGGAVAAAEIFASPAPGFQVFGSVNVGSARQSWALRLAACRTLASFCIGPDTAALGDAAGSEFRLGLGASAEPFEFIPLGLRIAGGYAVKSDGSSGGYGTFSLWRRF